jgi:hypothetical protein
MLVRTFDRIYAHSPAWCIIRMLEWQAEQQQKSSARFEAEARREKRRLARGARRCVMENRESQMERVNPADQRPCGIAGSGIGPELRATLALAAPLAAANLAQMAMSVTNTVMIGRLGVVPLAVAGLGGVHPRAAAPRPPGRPRRPCRRCQSRGPAEVAGAGRSCPRAPRHPTGRRPPRRRAPAPGPGRASAAAAG